MTMPDNIFIERTKKRNGKREEVKCKIKKTEDAIREARQNILDVPKQVEKAHILLVRLHTQFPSIHRLFIDNSQGTDEKNSEKTEGNQTNSEEKKTIQVTLERLDEQREKLRRLNRGESQGSESTNAVTCVLESLDLAEQFVSEVKHAAQKLQESGSNPPSVNELNQDVERLDASLTAGLRQIRNSFTLGKSFSALDEELSHLQVLLHSIRYEVATAERYSTLARLEAQVEHIFQVVKSVTADKESLVSLVRSTGISVEQWLQRFYFEIPFGPFRWTGNVIGFFPNRFHDIKRFIRKMSGTGKESLSYEQSPDTKGRIIAGLSVSLVSWLVIAISLIASVSIAKVTLELIIAGREDRAALAREKINEENSSIQDELDELSGRIASINNIPSDSDNSINLNYQKVDLLTGLLTSSVESEASDVDEYDAELQEIQLSCAVTDSDSDDGPSYSFQNGSVSECKSALATLEDATSDEFQDFSEFNDLKKVLDLTLNNLRNSQELNNDLANIDTDFLNLPRDFDSLSQEVESSFGSLVEDNNLLLVMGSDSDSIPQDIIVSRDNILEEFPVNGEDRESENREQNNIDWEEYDDDLIAIFEYLRQQENPISSSVDERIESATLTLLEWIQNPVYTNTLNQFMLALLAGAIGGIVSILTRLESVEQAHNVNSPFLYGLLQPLIGAAFSLVVMMILSTGLVDVIKVLPQEFHLRDTNIETLYRKEVGTSGNDSYVAVDGKLIDTNVRLTTEEVFIILVAGFIVGFSERLAKNAFVTVTSSPSANN
jgi:hypothetical protein